MQSKVTAEKGVADTEMSRRQLGGEQEKSKIIPRITVLIRVSTNRLISHARVAANAQLRAGQVVTMYRKYVPNR